MKSIFVLILTIIAFQATAQGLYLATLTAPSITVPQASPEKPTQRQVFFNWQSYRKTLDCKQLLTWGLFAASGMMHGAREAYHADLRIFEKNYDVSPESFWGSGAWKRNYVNNDPELPHKHEIFGNVGRDVWHTFGFASNVALFSGTFTIGARKQPLKYRATNALLGWGARSLFATLTYNSLRGQW